VDTTHSAGSGFLGGISESSINLEYGGDYEQYKEKLVFDEDMDVLRAGGAVFVRFRYYGASQGDIWYAASRSEDGSPDWIRRPPLIEGYLTAVGYAGKHQRLRDGVLRSFEEAAAGLLTQQSNLVKTRIKETNGSGSVTKSRQQSEGLLRNFYVLEWYIDPKTGGVHSLAIAQGAYN
jgi:hypothetical protein